MSNTPYEHGLDRRPANHVPLAPPSSPENAAQTCTRHPLVIRRCRLRPSQHVDACRLPGASTGKIQQFVLRYPAKSSSAIE